jgi:DNA-binding response OmpR family regulator
VVEDDEEARTQLALFLQNALYDVVCVEEFGDAVNQILQAKPDLILLDRNLPSVDGNEICAALRRVSRVPIIFVTGCDSSADELGGLLMGGDDYVIKPYHPSVLLARIAAVLKRSIPSGKDVRLTFGSLTLDIANAAVEAHGSTQELSKKEMQMLRYLFLHPNRYVSREDLSDFLWDHAVYLDENTLSVNMTRIRKKLAVLGSDVLIETKRGVGYKLCLGEANIERSH